MAVAGDRPWSFRWPARRDKEETGPVRLHRGRVYILPTRQGLTFSMVLLAMLLGAMNYGNSLAYAMTFLLGSIAVVSILHTYRNIAGLQVAAGLTAPVFAGEAALFRLTVDNRGVRRHAVTARFAQGEKVTTDLPPGNTILAVPVSTQRRGWRRPGTLTLATRYPLGLFRAWANVRLDTACLVYPRPEGTPVLPTGGGTNGEAGSHRGRGAGDFTGLRRYAPGDSLRHIHWKSVARGHLVTKQFAGDGGEELWLKWETAGKDPEARLAQLALWVVEAEKRALPYGLELPPGAAPGMPDSGRIPPGTGHRHHERCLRALALFGISDGAG